MLNVRFSASKLEQFRQYIQEEYHGFITKQMVIDSITGVSKWTPQATFGSAFGAVIQYGKDKYFNPDTKKYHVQDEQMPEAVILTEADVKHAHVFHVEHPQMTWESWIWHTLYVGNHKVAFPMRTDGLEGLQIHEVKTTTGQVQPEFYERSLQWKLYLNHLGGQFVEYHIFKYFKPSKKISTYRVEAPVDFKFYRYPNLENDLKHWTGRLLEFCDHNDLNDYIVHERKPRVRV